MCTLQFWTAARFIEGGWRCTGKDTLDAQTLLPSWRARSNKISLPPYIDYQLTSILMEKILGQLERAVLIGLKKLIAENKPDTRLTTIVVLLILMHSFELTFKHEVHYTKKRGIRVRHTLWYSKYGSL